MRLFVHEGGYTSLAVAITLLVSVSLVFSLATVEWVSARSADVQAVADAAALASSNTVASFCTVAQVADACVLSLALTGMAVLGAGLICAAVPGMRALSLQAMDMGKRILDVRTRFARDAAKGLRVLERALPYACMLNAASCAGANAQGGIGYRGAALPVPLESETDYSSLESEVSAAGLDKAAGRIREVTQKAEDARRRANEALERAWRADCVDAPSCLSSRAASLGGLSRSQNPTTPSADTWSFALPIRRSRAYYAARLAKEAPQAADIESVTDSVAREAFYEYALEEVRAAWCRVADDGSVSLKVPHLARNSSEVRGTRLYTDARWPTSLEEGGPTLHATLACPGAHGASGSKASVADIEDGVVARCAVCGMDVADLGAVAAISTTATNGYEHYWQAIVEAARDYEQARNDQAEAERAAKGAAEEGQRAFKQALEQLRGPRLHVEPPGRYGCVSMVTRGEGAPAPMGLAHPFGTDMTLPAGVAVSAACLHVDEAADGTEALSGFYTGVTRYVGSSQGGPLGQVIALWGKLLMGYEHAFEGTGRATDEFFGTVEGVFAGSVGSWLRSQLTRELETLGLEPADTALHKPALTSSDEVFRKAGIEGAGGVRALLESVSGGMSCEDLAVRLGVEVVDDVRKGRLRLAELVLPGTDVAVPLAVDLMLAGR